MSNVNVYIKDNIENVATGNIYVSPEIPEKKLNNAIKAFKCESFSNTILAIYDNTLLGSAKEGFVFTGEKMIHHKYGEFIYSDIKSIEHIENITINEKGKEKKEEFVIIKTKDNKEHKLEYGLVSIKQKEFVDFINHVINDFDSYEAEDQLKTISEMPNELKVAYLKIIINMTYIDDQNIDEKEFAEIFLLMTRLELDKDSRFDTRTYMTDISLNNIISNEDLLKVIKENSESSHYESIVLSLIKDLTNTYLSSKFKFNVESDKRKISDVIDECLEEFSFIKENKDLLNISDEKIDVAIEAIKTDYENLIGDRDDTAIEKSLKELSAKAAAAGTPLAAIYISGSVVGMSAAGITSGLATLGMGMGMTGGIAVVAIIGVLSYKGIKHLTGANELDKYKTRELMLHDVLKQTQKTISLIIEDVNYIVQKLNDTILNHADQKEKIQKMTMLVAKFQGALKSVDSKNNAYQNSVNRLQSPRILDEERLKSLTEEPTKKSLYSFIINNYEENEEKDFVLKNNVDTDILDKMAEIFKALGYFDMDNIVKSKAANGLKKVTGMFG